MEKKMETTIVHWGYIEVVLGVLYWDSGKENGNYYSILELYRGYIGVYIWIMEVRGAIV